ncbi:MAG TPA: MFS transporter [Candidatus Dormibacteraeota bacterium]|nr:MFS transporter [Candidatus Dormibacteraeota bacterium]
MPPPAPPPASLLRNPAFVSLWSAQTVSTFGSLITRVALPFMAILVLNATPAQIALLRAADLVPGFLVGLTAGVWVDRLRRRPVMITADIGRALLLGSIPLVALTGHARIEQLYLVAALASLLTVFFDVAEQSYIPAVVGRDRLLDANSKLAATQSIAEVGGFGVAGWLVQLFTAPVAIAVDAATFVVSAIFVATIRAPEPPAAPRTEPRGVWREMVEGLSALRADPALRTIALSVAALECAFGIVGTIYSLYVLRDLGFMPGLLGLVYAVGGVGSLGAAVLAGRVTRRFGIGPTMIVGLALAGIGILFMPLARGAGLAALLLLLAQQVVGDGGATIYAINETSLRQAIAPAPLIGRINAGIRVAALGATLLGTVVGAALAQTAGYRPTLVVGALVMVAGAMVILRSPVRQRRA